MTKSTRALSGASLRRVSVLSLPSGGCGILLGLEGPVSALVVLEVAAPEPLWPVHPLATSAATTMASSGRRAAPEGRVGPFARRRMLPPWFKAP